MAEVLGIISAVAGVADVGFRLSVTLYRYGHAVAIPSEAIINIQPEVTSLSAALKQLESGLSDDENLRVCKDETLEGTRVIAVTCGKALEEIKEIVEKYFQDDKITIIDRLRRYKMEKRVNLLRANMDRLKSTIILMLEVIKYARSIVKQQQSPKERDREILLALQQANEDATLRYEKLLTAVENPGSRVQDYISSLDISSCTTEVSGSNSQSYAVVDKSGAVIWCRNNELAFKFETITRIINDIEQAQTEIADVTASSGIWEISVGAGEQRHFRLTEITTYPKTRMIEQVRSLKSQQHPVEHKIVDVYIALMGAVGSGKSAFVNLCCGENLARISQAPGHCTERIDEYHFMYTPEIRVHLIDTPGFDDAHRSERETLTDLAEWMSQSHGATARLTGIIYLHRISDLGVHFSSHRNLRIFEKLCGPDACHSVILATTNWDALGDQEAAMRHEEDLYTNDKYWGMMIKLGSSVLRHTGDNDSAMHILATLGSLSQTESMVSQHNPHMEPMERKRGFSASSIGFQSRNDEAKVNQLLAEYTTVIDVPQVQNRRWTMDPIF